MSPFVINPVPENDDLKSLLDVPPNQADPAPKNRVMQEDISVTATDLDYHSSMVLSHWDKLISILDTLDIPADLDGKTLDLATVVAVARYGVSARAKGNVSRDVAGSAEFLTACLTEGQCIYGVNTGFGGSANTRTCEMEKLQIGLINFLNCGILALPGDVMTKKKKIRGHTCFSFARAFPNEDPAASTFMPEPWVRAALVVRTNSLISGNSGVRPCLIKSLTELLRNSITPIIPLRGSISASGDLIPLSYIAGAVQGNPSINVWTREKDLENETRSLLSADVALSNSSLSSLKLEPKEGLAIVNGTSMSTGAGALALHDAHCLLVLSQVLTSMCVEALQGTSESFDVFFGQIRPHKGQFEVARNIKGFLAGSKLAIRPGHEKVDDSSLRQDRYAIRTSSQWIGPQLEDLMLAHEQITVECNSTTDNPVIDTAGKRILHGGNFQAMSVTSAMEKTRSSLQIIGRMLFAQCTELINPSLNNGLPPNLDVDEPSQSFLMKGVDISIAGLQAELGFLANPIANHVQTAEMGNQSLNSLALVSARYTHISLDVLSQLAAAYLFVLCQALDLRVLQVCFLKTFNPVFEATTKKILSPVIGNVDSLHVLLWLHFQRELNRTTSIDSSQRFAYLVKCLQPTVLSFASSSAQTDAGFIPALLQWTDSCAELSLQIFHECRDAYLMRPDPKDFLGSASSRMYQFVRRGLEIPFQTGTVPETSIHNGEGLSNTVATTGSFITRIYVALRNGELYVPVMDCLREVLAEAQKAKSRSNGSCGDPRSI
ncbi:hypothetical protein MMC07_008144 [Pseudocyphellaria aurata]|nr:hypothetical protein [Pseudocyphellaria aurata]